MIQLKSMPEKLKAINFWFYRVVLILILIFIANLGGIIAWTDSLRNPPLREPNEGDLEINPQEDISYLKETLTQIFPEGIFRLGGGRCGSEARGSKVLKKSFRWLPSTLISRKISPRPGF